MLIILDTNVVSELMRQAPNPRVVAWLGRQPLSSLVTTSLTVAEIWAGFSILPGGRRQQDLQQAAAAIFAMFEHSYGGRILPFDEQAGAAYGVITAERRRSGRPIKTIDAQIAAVARTRQAAVATRDEDDFAGLDLPVINPWTAG